MPESDLHINVRMGPRALGVFSLGDGWVNLAGLPVQHRKGSVGLGRDTAT